MHGRICTGDMQILSILWKELEYLQFGRWGVPGMNLPHPHSHGYRERTVKFSLFVNPWIAARQASLSITNSGSSLKLLSIKAVMPSSHLILCGPLLLLPIKAVMPSSHLILCGPLLFLPPIPPSIRVFSNESTLRMKWSKYWSFSFNISPSKKHQGLISFRMDWLDLLAVQGTRKSPLQHHSSKASILRHSAFFTVQLSHPYMTTGKTIALTRHRPLLAK